MFLLVVKSLQGLPIIYRYKSSNARAQQKLPLYPAHTHDFWLLLKPLFMFDNYFYPETLISLHTHWNLNHCYPRPSLFLHIHFTPKIHCVNFFLSCISCWHSKFFKLAISLSACEFPLIALRIQVALNHGEVHFPLQDSYWPLRRKFMGQGGKLCSLFTERPLWQYLVCSPPPFLLLTDCLQPGRAWLLCTTTISVCFCLYDHMSFLAAFSLLQLLTTWIREKLLSTVTFLICPISLISWHLIPFKISFCHSEIWKDPVLSWKIKYFLVTSLAHEKLLVPGAVSPVFWPLKTFLHTGTPRIIFYFHHLQQLFLPKFSCCPSHFKNSSKKFHKLMFYSNIFKWFPLN